MSLNIKNERVHDLVRRAAEKTGETQTAVVETAMLRYVEELERETDYALAEAILLDMQQRWRESTTTILTQEDLYDPITGLPA